MYKKIKSIVFIISAISISVISISAYSVAKNYLYNDYSNDAAVEYLVEHAESRSKSSCALYVRRAISAGGCPTFGQPPSACDYDLFLPDLGFNEVPQDGYVPQKGDVVVFSAIKGHKHGHICMYDGHQWISDFKQRSMYSANAYRNNGMHTYWRRPDGKAWRKISLKSWRRAIAIALGI